MPTPLEGASYPAALACEMQGQLISLPRHQHGLKWQSRLLASTWFLVVTWVTDIIDPSCHRTINADMALSSSMGPDVTMAPRW